MSEVLDHQAFELDQVYRGPRPGFMRVIHGELEDAAEVVKPTDLGLGFEDAFEFIDRRAAEFYGVGTLEPRRNAQFRLFKKMLDRVQGLDRPELVMNNDLVSNAHSWLLQFRTNAQRYVELGDKNFEAPIRNGAKKLSIQVEDEPRVLRMRDVYSHPGTRQSVWAWLRDHQEPTVILLDHLRSWPDRTNTAVPDRYREMAERTFDRILFSIQGDTIMPMMSQMAHESLAQSTE